MNNVSIAVAALIVAVFVLAVALLFVWRRSASLQKQSEPMPTHLTAELVPIHSEVSVVATKPVARVQPDSVVVGDDPSRPAIEIRTLSDEARFGRARAIELTGSSLPGRLNAALQAVPSVIAQQAQSGKLIMEVVINGELVRAASGEGYRAFAKEGGKIVEHGLLKDASGLNNAVNAAAVWQIASVVVAQKHLADISEKLDTVIKGVGKISEFLDTERRAKIVAAHNYLKQTSRSIGQGELSAALRIELESCERDLLAVQEHLFSQYRNEAKRAIKSTETFGTQKLAQDLKARYVTMQNHVQDLQLCINTRALAWYVLSLYPGEPQLKHARASTISEAIRELREMEIISQAALSEDLPKISAFTNTKGTLLERKSSVQDAANMLAMTLNSVQIDCTNNVEQSSRMLLQYDKPMSLFVELDNGQLSSVRTI